MLRSMFAKLMAVVLAIVLVCMLALFSLFYLSMRDSYIDNRMDSLKSQAYEIAYLASRVRNNDMLFPFSSSKNPYSSKNSTSGSTYTGDTPNASAISLTDIA